MTDKNFSPSENAGLNLVTSEMRNILSVGISTGGAAEIRMAQIAPAAHIIATTLEEKGIAFATDLILAAGLKDRIEVRLEDVSEPMPYDDEEFDYVYARLVLHYLTKQSLESALNNIYRVLRTGANLFVVVRSSECPDAKLPGASYDAVTGLTQYTLGGKVSSRQFHTKESIGAALEKAGFTINSIEQFNERLFSDFERKNISPHTDNVIQLVAQK